MNIENSEDDGRNQQKEDVRNNQPCGITKANEKLGRYGKQLLEMIYNFCFSTVEWIEPISKTAGGLHAREKSHILENKPTPDQPTNSSHHHTIVPKK